MFANGTSINYLYEGQTASNGAGATSRLQCFTDAKNQRTNYTYYNDDNLKQANYTNTAGRPLSPPTPSVTFTYDPNYNRVATTADGTGTTTYAYKPITGGVSLGAGRLQSVDGPLVNDTITYTYDELGRELSHAINGSTASQTFDALGRVSGTTNALGSFALLRWRDAAAADAFAPERPLGLVHLLVQQRRSSTPVAAKPFRGRFDPGFSV